MGFLNYRQVPAINGTTNATPNTVNTVIFHKPGARTMKMMGVGVQGKNVSLSLLHSIEFRVQKWTTTASAIGTGTSITPAPDAQADRVALFTSAYSLAASSLLNNGTGGPTPLKIFGCTATGPGGWNAESEGPDAGFDLNGGVNMSIDVLVASGLASLLYAIDTRIQE